MKMSSNIPFWQFYDNELLMSIPKALFSDSTHVATSIDEIKLAILDIIT